MQIQELVGVRHYSEAVGVVVDCFQAVGPSEEEGQVVAAVLPLGVVNP